MKYDILLLKMSNNGKGISVGIAETEDHYEYQVQRLYKEIIKIRGFRVFVVKLVSRSFGK